MFARKEKPLPTPVLQPVKPAYKDPNLVTDGIHLGDDYYWNPEILPNGHIVAIGASGSGKTQTLKAIAYSLHTTYPNLQVILLDFHGDQEIPATSPASLPVKRTPKLEPRDIKISLTLSSPEDLKVKPGDKIVKGQTLSDRADDRSRLNARKKQLELTLAKLDLPLPHLTPPKSIQPLSKLPPISYQEERANIKLKEQELSKADKAIANQQEKIKQLRALFQTNAEDRECFGKSMHGCKEDIKSKLSSAPGPLGSSANQSLKVTCKNNLDK
jgi:energy-coupling factor transporter ATP-binding protein EcfA2